MNPQDTSTKELVEIVKQQATSGQEPEQAILHELQVRYGWIGCPKEDLALIADLDHSVLMPIFRWTKLPPRIRHMPGAKMPPAPVYYQKLWKQHSSAINATNSATSKIHQVFVASSLEAKAQAKALMSDLAQPTICFRPWWEMIRPGRMFLSELMQATRETSAALFIFTPDIKGTFRRKRVKLPNQNVLFELGYFFTTVKPECIALIKYGDVMIPGDLDGYTHIPGSKSFVPKRFIKAGKATKVEFSKWVSGLEK